MPVEDPMLELARSVRDGRHSAAGVVRETLDRIERQDAALNAFRETYRCRALQLANDLDHQIAAGLRVGHLAGVPVAVKDNIATDFGRTSCSSRLLEEYRSPYTATVVRRLEGAGAIIVGKTNGDEFAMGSSSETCAFGPVRNPWDPSRVPGGSSGGSAAAVAAGLCPAALGSDTGGSVRQPAAMCGMVGVKPTYGRVSRHGLVAYGSSLDQVGPMARTVRDTAVLLQVIAGGDRYDSTAADVAVPDYLEQIETPVPDLILGVPRQYLSEHSDADVLDAVQRAVHVYRELGARIVDVDLPLTDSGVATYYIIAPAEASSNLARFDGIRYGRRAELGPGEELFDLYARSRAEGFGPEVQRRIMLGTYVLSAGYYDAYYKRAMQVRQLIAGEFERVFRQCHALLGPTSPVPAFGLGARPAGLSMYLCDIFTTLANIAGHCAISVPCGFVERDGATLPVGLHIQCPAWDEVTLFRVARQFEAATDYHVRRPEVAPAD